MLKIKKISYHGIWTSLHTIPNAYWKLVVQVRTSDVSGLRTSICTIQLLSYWPLERIRISSKILDTNLVEKSPYSSYVNLRRICK